MGEIGTGKDYLYSTSFRVKFLELVSISISKLVTISTSKLKKAYSYGVQCQTSFCAHFTLALHLK